MNCCRLSFYLWWAVARFFIENFSVRYSKNSDYTSQVLQLKFQPNIDSYSSKLTAHRKYFIRFTCTLRFFNEIFFLFLISSRMHKLSITTKRTHEGHDTRNFYSFFLLFEIACKHFSLLSPRVCCFTRTQTWSTA